MTQRSYLLMDKGSMDCQDLLALWMELRGRDCWMGSRERGCLDSVPLKDTELKVVLQMGMDVLMVQRGN